MRSLMSNGRIGGVLVLVVMTWGCGGQIESTTAESPDASGNIVGTDGGSAENSAPDASANVVGTDGAGADSVLVRYVVPESPPPPPGEGESAGQCLYGESLPIEANGLPNCVVVSARPVSSPEQLAACKRCDVPGLAPFVAPVPLETIGEGLSKQPCLCAVSASPPGPMCPVESSSAFWCYAPSAPTCQRQPSAALGFSQRATESGTLYIACFAP
jgi:hypothetical protein